MSNNNDDDVAPIIFDSDSSEFNHIKIIDILRATSAAPTYFDS